MRIIISNISNSIIARKNYVLAFFIIFYIVGFLGLAFPFSHHIFLKLFPLALILSFAAILLFHHDSYNVRAVLVLSAIVFMGYIIEVVGVNTSLIFGSYIYGDALGFKALNTPLLIGVNWAMLSYAGSSVTEKLHVHVSLKIVIASLLLLTYDIILEQIAPALNMWYWNEDVVPAQNYLAWFIIALVFQIVIKYYRLKTRNWIAGKVILIQAVFFISLLVLNEILNAYPV
jgi:putative membrane protein